MKKFSLLLASAAITSSLAVGPTMVESIWAAPQSPTATSLNFSFEQIAENTVITAEKTRINVEAREKAIKEKPIIEKAIKDQLDKNKREAIAKKKAEEARKKAEAKRKAEEAKKKAEKLRKEREAAAAREAAERAEQERLAQEQAAQEEQYTVVTYYTTTPSNGSSSSNASNSSRKVQAPSPVVVNGELNPRVKQAIEFAMSKRGIPYRWGGTTDAGYDCSGLVQAAYRSAGISLPRVASAQLNVGTPVSRGQLQPGDLVGFHGGGHIGIYIGDGYYIHAPRTGDVVKVSKLRSLWKATRLV